MKLSPIWLKQLEVNYYVSISELPIKKWNLLHTTGKLKHLCREGRKVDYRAKLVYQQLNEELVDTFGISKSHKKQLSIQIQIELMWAKYFDKGDKSIILQITALETELENITNQKTDYDLYDSLVSLNKSGITADINTMTVLDYFNYAKSLSKLIKNENS